MLVHLVRLPRASQSSNPNSFTSVTLSLSPTSAVFLLHFQGAVKKVDSVLMYSTMVPWYCEKDLSGVWDNTLTSVLERCSQSVKVSKCCQHRWMSFSQSVDTKYQSVLWKCFQRAGDWGTVKVRWENAVASHWKATLLTPKSTSTYVHTTTYCPELSHRWQ